MSAIIKIPSYNGDDIERVGILDKFIATRDGHNVVVVRIGHDGGATHKIYRAYRFDRCDKGIFELREQGMVEIGRPV